MKKYLFILFLLMPCMSGFAQNVDETAVEPSAFTHSSDSVATKSSTQKKHATETISTWKPNPMKAVWMGTIIPGYGQIYNRSYWKLPIVYGGLMGCVYAITYTNRTYTDYKQAYRDIYSDATISTDPNRSYIAMLPEGYTVDMMGGKNGYTTFLQNKQNTFRRYRDISIVATVVVYALSLIDAYVDAQLYDFDISTDLSMNVEPLLYNDMLNNRSAELKLAINF